MITAEPSILAQTSDVDGIGDWQQGPPYGAVGSGRLAGMLRTSIRVLESRVPVPSTSRPRRALQWLETINNQPELISNRDLETLRVLPSIHRTAWDTFLIAHAMRLTRERPYTPFTPEKLAQFLKGANVEGRRNTTPRNIQFELTTAAMLAIGGVEVYPNEPDVRFDYGRERVGIAAKRIMSPAPKQLRTHIKKAIEQIGGTGIRGFIAVNLDSRFQRVDPAQPPPNLFPEFTRIFDTVNRSIDKWANDVQVLGIMTFGHAAAWQFPENGLPQLRTVSPMRWNLVGDHDFEFEMFKDFLEAWGSRYKRRMLAIVEGNIEN